MSTNNCLFSFKNSGLDPCWSTFEKAKKMIVVPYYNSLGVINAIPAVKPGTVATGGSTTLTGTGTTFLTTYKPGNIICVAGETRRTIVSIASNTSLTVSVAFVTTASTLAYDVLNNYFFVSMANHPDPSQRWYFLPILRNPSNGRDKSIFETAKDNSVSLVQQGIRKIEAEIWAKDGASPVMVGILKSYRQQAFGIFIEDLSNNVHGMQNSTGLFAPWRMDQNSWDPIWNPGTDTTTSKIMLSGNVSTTEKDENVCMIQASNIDPAADIQDINGIIDVTGVYTSPAHALVKLKLNTNGGDITNASNVHGLTVGNFNGVKVSGSGTYGAPTSVTEEVDTNGIPTGIYDIVFSAPAAADVITITVTEDGFNFIAVNNTPVTLT